MIDIELAEMALELSKKFDKMPENNLQNKLVESVKNYSKETATACAAVGLPRTGELALAGIIADFIYHMYTDINRQLGIFFSEHLVKSLAEEITTYLAFNYLGLRTIFMFRSVIAIISVSTIVSIASYAVALTSGYVYMKTLILLANRDGFNVNEEQLKIAAKKVIKDTNIRKIIKHAKDSYKI